MAAAWRRQRTAVCAWVCQKFASVTPLPTPAVSAAARIMAVCGRSHPRTGDQRSVEGTPAANPCGSNTPTGRPSLARAVMVVVRLSGRVEVVMTAPGASRIEGMMTLKPLPAPGGPSSTRESRTPIQHSIPRLLPRYQPTSRGLGWMSDGRSTAAWERSAFGPAHAATWARSARPSSVLGSLDGLPAARAGRKICHAPQASNPKTVRKRPVVDQ